MAPQLDHDEEDDLNKRAGSIIMTVQICVGILLTCVGVYATWVFSKVDSAMQGENLDDQTAEKISMFGGIISTAITLLPVIFIFLFLVFWLLKVRSKNRKDPTL